MLFGWAIHNGYTDYNVVRMYYPIYPKRLSVMLFELLLNEQWFYNTRKKVETKNENLTVFAIVLCYIVSDVNKVSFKQFFFFFLYTTEASYRKLSRYT